MARAVRAAAPRASSPPRRLAPAARREQLVRAALPVVAGEGFDDFSLDAVAERAGVTRNLLYHYFPRGRPDIVLAVVELALGELTDNWQLDGARPLVQRVEANFARMAEHARRPSPAWRIQRRCRTADDPEVRARHEAFLDRLVARISANQLGTPEPGPTERLALRGYLAFAETVLEEARDSAAPEAKVARLLRQTLAAAVAATRPA